jgi:PAS domain S-box-containing protein
MTDNAAVKALRLSEERFRRLFETARDGILLLDALTGHIVEANPYMSEITAYTRSEILGRFIWDLGFAWDVTEAKARFLELQQNDFVRYENLPFKTKVGATRHVEFVSNVYLVDGTRVIQCNIRDISERVAAEDSAANLLSMYRTISRCNVALVHAKDERSLVAAICKVLVEESKFFRAWVGFTVTAKESRMKPIAAFSPEGDYLGELLTTFEDKLIEDGPVATAIKTQRTIISQDLRTDSLKGL